MRLGYIVLIVLNLISLSVCAQSVEMDDNMADKELQIIRCLQRMDVDYSAEYDAWSFGLPNPDTLKLRNEYGDELLAYEICPAIPIGIVICISGIDAPSVSAYYGHASEFYKRGYATFTMDVSSHITIDDKRYEEVKDVQAVIDYIKSKMDYTNLPVVVMGVAMGGTVAIRSMIESYDISAVISLSAFSSFEDYFALNRKGADPRYNLPNITVKELVDMTAEDSVSLSRLCHHVKGIDHRPILLMQSKRDKFVPFSYFSRLTKEMSKYTNQLESYVVEGDEHYICRDFIDPSSDKDYFEVLMGFLKRITTNQPVSAYRKLEDTQAI